MATAEEDARRSARFTQILSRLRELPNYTWSPEFEPFHSSYDNWHFVGIQKAVRDRPISRGRSFGATSASSSSSSPDASRPTLSRNHRSSGSNASITAQATQPTQDSQQTHDDDKPRDRMVVCRVSSHTLRLEREFQICQLIHKKDPGAARHFVRPVDFVRLPTKPGNTEPLAASIVEAPGDNYLRELVQFGPNSYKVTRQDNQWKFRPLQLKDCIPLLTFLDFAVGATECLEILHHGHELVHGEIRGDAFHFAGDGTVRMVNFGSGARAFENGLTSAGWNVLSKERGIELKLAFIAPEQTGRMPAEPDSRTDIYSLGILFYLMLCGETPFDGPTPLDVMQNVLNKRIPPVSSKRIDIPEALSNVIQRMTQKKIEERYHVSLLGAAMYYLEKFG